MNSDKESKKLYMIRITLPPDSGSLVDDSRKTPTFGDLKIFFKNHCRGCHSTEYYCLTELPDNDKQAENQLKMIYINLQRHLEMKKIMMSWGPLLDIGWTGKISPGERVLVEVSPN